MIEEMTCKKKGIKLHALTFLAEGYSGGGGAKSMLPYPLHEKGGGGKEGKQRMEYGKEGEN